MKTPKKSPLATTITSEVDICDMKLYLTLSLSHKEHTRTLSLFLITISNVFSLKILPMEFFCWETHFVRIMITTTTTIAERLKTKTCFFLNSIHLSLSLSSFDCERTLETADLCETDWMNDMRRMCLCTSKYDENDNNNYDDNDNDDCHNINSSNRFNMSCKQIYIMYFSLSLHLCMINRILHKCHFFFVPSTEF